MQLPGWYSWHQLVVAYNLARFLSDINPEWIPHRDELKEVIDNAQKS